MQLKVRLATGDLGEIVVEPSDTVQHIKEAAKALLRCPVDRVSLWAHTCELKDGHLLDEYREYCGTSFQYGVLLIPDMRGFNVDAMASETVPQSKKARLESNDTSDGAYDLEQVSIEKLRSLLDRDYSELEACSLYIDLIATKPLHEFVVDLPRYREKLFEMAKSVLACLKAVSRDIDEFIRFTRKKQPEEAEKVLSLSPLVQLFALALMREDESDWSYNFNEWTRLLEESIKVLNPPPKPPTKSVIVTDEDYTGFQYSLSISRDCNDPNFIEMIPARINEVNDVHKKSKKIDGDAPQRRNLAGPFVFVCASSGCGKTTFAYNLGCAKYPSLYFVFSNNWTDSQIAYGPFFTLSNALEDYLNADILKVNANSDANLLDEEKYNVANLVKMVDNLDFGTVHFIVELFQQLCRFKSRFPKVSWIEAQVSISEYTIGSSNINDGKEALAALKQEHPFMVFVDECIIPQAAQASVLVQGNPSAKRYILLRSILRLMNVLPIVAGTDVGSSNFCSKSSSRMSGSTPLWALAINHLPPFSETLFKWYKERLEIRMPTESGALQLIIKLISSSYLQENPWIITLIFEYLLNFDYQNYVSLSDLLSKLFKQLLEIYLERKSRPPEFNLAQIAYILNYKWQKTTPSTGYELVLNQAHEVAINRHVGYLRGETVEPSSHFMLGLRSEGVRCYLNMVDGNFVYGADYEPKSAFTSFMAAPFTGLMLFGLDDAHLPLWTKTGATMKRISSLDAVIENYWSLNTNRNNYGALMEHMYNTATVMASRGRGLNGFNYRTFLARFIRELSTVRPTPSSHFSGIVRTNNRQDDSLIEDVPIVTVENDDVGDKQIPLLAPMASPSWPRHVAKLLLETFGKESRLGTFQYTTSNDRVDHIIFELNNESIDEFPDPEKCPVYPLLERFDIMPSWIKKISMIGECRYREDGVYLSAILKDIVNGKFNDKSKWQVPDGVDVDGCDLFQILIPTFNAPTNSRKKTLKRLRECNEKRIYLWTIVKTSTSKENQMTFMLTPIFGQMERMPGSKDIIIIPLDEIVGSDFVAALK